MTSPFRLWARSGAEQINGQHSTCRRRKMTEAIYAPARPANRTVSKEW
ncbi:TPA: hypothetical protein ACNFOY_001571 [Enterobacter chuandaensis]